MARDLFPLSSRSLSHPAFTLPSHSPPLVTLAYLPPAGWFSQKMLRQRQRRQRHWWWRKQREQCRIQWKSTYLLLEFPASWLGLPAWTGETKAAVIFMTIWNKFPRNISEVWRQLEDLEGNRMKSEGTRFHPHSLSKDFMTLWRHCTVPK